jgi:hypothetical protein
LPLRKSEQNKKCDRLGSHFIFIQMFISRQLTEKGACLYQIIPSVFAELKPPKSKKIKFQIVPNGD